MGQIPYLISLAIYRGLLNLVSKYHIVLLSVFVALIWQMMRTYTLKILSSITPGKKLEDAEIVVWVNTKVCSVQKCIGTLMLKYNLGNLTIISLCFVNLLF